MTSRSPRRDGCAPSSSSSPQQSPLSAHTVVPCAKPVSQRKLAFSALAGDPVRNSLLKPAPAAAAGVAMEWAKNLLQAIQRGTVHPHDAQPTIQCLSELQAAAAEPTTADGATVALCAVAATAAEALTPGQRRQLLNTLGRIVARSPPDSKVPAPPGNAGAGGSSTSTGKGSTEASMASIVALADPAAPPLLDLESWAHTSITRLAAWARVPVAGAGQESSEAWTHEHERSSATGHTTLPMSSAMATLPPQTPVDSESLCDSINTTTVLSSTVTRLNLAAGCDAQEPAVPGQRCERPLVEPLPEREESLSSGRAGLHAAAADPSPTLRRLVHALEGCVRRSLGTDVTPRRGSRSVSPAAAQWSLAALALAKLVADDAALGPVFATSAAAPVRRPALLAPAPHCRWLASSTASTCLADSVVCAGLGRSSCS